MATPVAPANTDGYSHMLLTGDNTFQTVTLPAETTRRIFSVQFRAYVEDATFDDEGSVEYILPAGQAESINAKSMGGWVFKIKQATSAGTVRLRILYGKGI